MTGTAMIQTMVSVKSSSFNPGGKQSASADQSSGSFKDLLSDAGGQVSDRPGHTDAAGQERPVKQEAADEQSEKTPVKDDRDEEENAVLKETASVLQSGVPGAESVLQPEEAYGGEQPAAPVEESGTAVQEVTVKQESSVWDMATWDMTSRDMILKAGIQQGPANIQEALQGGVKSEDLISQQQNTSHETMVSQDAADLLDAISQSKDSMTTQNPDGKAAGNIRPVTEVRQQAVSIQETQVSISQTGQTDQTGHLQSMESQIQQDAGKAQMAGEGAQTQDTGKTQTAGEGARTQDAGKLAGGQPDQAAQKDFTAQTPVVKAETQQQNMSQEDGAQTGTYSRSAADLKLDQLTKTAKQAEPQDTAALQAAAGGSQPAEVETVTIKVAEPYEQGIRELPKNLAEQIQTHMTEGKREFVVQLAPEQLGRIAIRISTSDAGVKVLLSCENQKTMELLTQKASQISQIVEHNTGGQAVVEVKEDNYWSQQKNPTDEHRNQNQGGQDQRRQDQDHGREESEDFIQQLRLGLYSHGLAAGL